MGQNRYFVEGWQEILSETLSAADEYFTRTIVVGDSSEDLGEPCAGLEWCVNVAFAITDDVNLRMYTERKLSAAGNYIRSLEAKATTLLSCGGVSPYNLCDKPAESDIGGAVSFSAQRTGSETDIVVTLWARRYRYV